MVYEIAQAGDSNDWAEHAELFAAHWNDVHAVALGYTRSSFDADDLTSRAFVRMRNAIKNGRGPTDGGYLAYLCTIVRRLVYDDTKQEKRQRRAFVRYESSKPFVVDNIARRLTLMDVAQLGPALSRAFGSLSDRHQLVLKLVVVDERIPSEVASVFGLTANGVSALKYRAKENLRKYFAEERAKERAQTGWGESEQERISA